MGVGVGISDTFLNLQYLKIKIIFAVLNVSFKCMYCLLFQGQKFLGCWGFFVVFFFGGLHNYCPSEMFLVKKYFWP